MFVSYLLLCEKCLSQAYIQTNCFLPRGKANCLYLGGKKKRGHLKHLPPKNAKEVYTVEILNIQQTSSFWHEVFIMDLQDLYRCICRALCGSLQMHLQRSVWISTDASVEIYMDLYRCICRAPLYVYLAQKLSKLDKWINL